jgi:site-specific recombinase XerD
MRKDEIIMACWGWFHMDTHTISIPDVQNVDGWKWTPKTKSGRNIPISKDFHSFLSTQTFSQGFILHPEAKGRKRYAKTPRKHPRRYRWDFRRPLQDYLESQNVVCNAHAMRHSFASNLLRGGTRIGVVAKMIGDSISTTEKIYANFRPRKGDLDHVF